jgi:hypothetical protein
MSDVPVLKPQEVVRILVRKFGICRGCHSQGDTFEETIENITEAIELYLESLKADNEPIPKEDLIHLNWRTTG